MTPNTIEFRSTSDNTWVMRITADRKIEVNEDVDVTFAAQKVLDAMQYLLKAQRTWVGLTDQDVDGFVEQYWDDDNMTMRLMMKAIEFRLKQLNT